MNPSFGDHVRIRVRRETQDAGVAGLEGSVWGMTTPSVTGVDVIGLEGVDKKWIRTENGGWREESTKQEKKPWWKFW